jgi:hypothetical protein
MNRGDERPRRESAQFQAHNRNMKLTNIPFGTADWTQVPPERKAGESGWA